MIEKALEYLLEDRERERAVTVDARRALRVSSSGEGEFASRMSSTVTGWRDERICQFRGTLRRKWSLETHHEIDPFQTAALAHDGWRAALPGSLTQANFPHARLRGSSERERVYMRPRRGPPAVLAQALEKLEAENGDEDEECDCDERGDEGRAREGRVGPA